MAKKYVKCLQLCNKKTDYRLLCEEQGPWARMVEHGKKVGLQTEEVRVFQSSETELPFNSKPEKAQVSQKEGGL